MKTPTDLQLSRLLSMILRHKPGNIDCSPDAYGYVSIDELVSHATEKGYLISRQDLIAFVNEPSGKQRFKLSGDKLKATYGHSFEVKSEEPSRQPPDLLYHGTKTSSKESILREGLVRMKQNAVHLYDNYYDALLTGNRITRGPVVFEIDAAQLFRDGFEFYAAAKNTWHTTSVPAKYLTVKTPDEVIIGEKLTFTKTTFYTKLVKADFTLDPVFNRDVTLYVRNCFICNTEQSYYTFEKDRAYCREQTYERQKIQHILPGKTTGFEQVQNEEEIIVKAGFEISLPKGRTLGIRDLTGFDGIGIRFHCSECSQPDFISNMSKKGDVFQCRNCHLPLFRIDRHTDLKQERND